MVMPRQMLVEAINGNTPMILPSIKALPINIEEQVQISSIDLRLGVMCTGIKTAVVPHGEKVADLIAQFGELDFSLSFDDTSILKRGQTYIIPLLESCRLPPGYWMDFSPKSSTGRIDVFVCVICDLHSGLDRTPEGYCGPLYLRVTPLSFDVRVKAGDTLVQGRVKSKKTKTLNDGELRRLHVREGIAFDKHGKPIDKKKIDIRNGRFYFSIDLDRDVVGFRAKREVVHELDMTRSGVHDPELFWEPIRRPKDGNLILSPNEFVLLATAERVRIPARYSGEIIPVEFQTGEFRPHYAGYFDPGFGGTYGTTGVLEVRAFTVPFRLVHGQAICAMIFQPTFVQADRLYQGHYTKSGPSLSKHFASRYDAWTSAFWRSRW